MNRLLTSLFALAVLVMGCTSGPRQPDREPNFVLVGVDANHPPFEYLDSGTGDVVGFDLELIALICRANGWSHEVVPVRFHNLIDALNHGDIDIAVSAMTITPKRGALVAFSDPYYLAGQALVLPVEDSSSSALMDLRGRRAGVVVGTTGEELARSTDGLLVYPCDDVAHALSDLAAGNLDAVVADYPTVRAIIVGHPGLRIAQAYLNSEYYGIAMRPDDTIRLERLNDALASLLGGYAYEQLHLKWFGYPLLDVAVPDSVSAVWPAQ
jgi:ABC-type amino acid transport substrate-binding protein